MSTAKHKWVFRARFRRHSFGWRSRPAVERVKQAVKEIRSVARSDPALGAEGAVLFLERVSAALEHVDSSSGAIGTAVYRAIEDLVPIIARAPVDRPVRERWLERLWTAYEEDQIPYIESLGDHWGELCVAPELASEWADRLVPTVRMAWSPDPELRGFYKGTTNCLSALFTAGRHEEILELVELPGPKLWHYRRWAVLALSALGRKADALRYAEASRSRNDPDQPISATCEEILLSSGLADEAYERYGLEANERNTRLAWFRAVVAKYPHKAPRQVLADLAAATPGTEGKWFAAAKDAGFFAEAIALANASPADPQTLTRAARDYEATQPHFAMEAGLCAVRGLLAGYGYEVTSFDAFAACDHTLRAARNAGAEKEARARMAAMVAGSGSAPEWLTAIVTKALAPD